MTLTWPESTQIGSGSRHIFRCREEFRESLQIPNGIGFGMILPRMHRYPLENLPRNVFTYDYIPPL